MPKKKAAQKKTRKKPAAKKKPVKRKATKKKPLLPKAHQDIEKEARTGIPNYDPWRDAGDCVFDHARALRAIEKYESHIFHVEGELGDEFGGRGQPYILEPHERAIMANLFGWYKPDGFRRYREVFYFVPRKNSKTTFLAGLVVIINWFDHEPGAKNYFASASAEQADIAFQLALSFVENNDDLAGNTYKKSIINTERKSFIQILSSAADTKHGRNPHAALLDELHVMDQDLVDVMVTGQGARRQPIIFYATTSDFERESICNMMYKMATDVRDGVINNQGFLPVIFEATKDENWEDEKIWYKANPNLGKSISIDYFRAQYAKAKSLPTFENTFKRLHLNIRTEQESRWIPMDLWHKCGWGAEPIGWRRRMISEMRGNFCAAGLDLGSTSDLSALVLAFKPEDKIILMPYFWMPKDSIARKDRKTRDLYTTWISHGFITTTPGRTLDAGFIRADINSLVDDHGLSIQEIACDRLFQGHQLMKELVDDGFEAFAHGQGFYGMANPTKAFEEHILDGKIDHGNNPVLTWMAGNAMVLFDPAGNMKVTKSVGRGKGKVQRLKVDGIVASVMALGRIAIMEDSSTSIYDDPEMGVWL
jgi:phage terminase large subunit-like protein